MQATSSPTAPASGCPDPLIASKAYTSGDRRALAVLRGAECIHPATADMESIMRTSRLVLAAVVFLVGLVWTGQGLGFIGGSVMSNVGFFAILGAALMVAGVVIALRERQAASRP